jgi:quercetin 2,3-dioxygenase
MDTQTQAQIYLADQRGYSEDSLINSYHTFNFGAYVAEGREPFGALQLLNDDILRAGASMTMLVENATDVMLLPITGSLGYQVGALPEDFMEPGQVGILSLSAGNSYTISNPYETESINCLQFWFTNTAASSAITSQTSFDLTNQNRLLPIFGATDSANHVFVGRYGGREECAYQLTNLANGLFVFVIQGAFDVANRLLQEKDGLSLVNLTGGKVEFEALSDDAILLLIEVSLV